VVAPGGGAEEGGKLDAALSRELQRRMAW
jgi:ADP-ribose pyrophosphatase YjhB (NUDIX family)